MKKIIFGVLTLIAISASLKVQADTESSGGQGSGDCVDKPNNVCVIVHVPIIGNKEIPGLLKVVIK